MTGMAVERPVVGPEALQRARATPRGLQLIAVELALNGLAERAMRELLVNAEAFREDPDTNERQELVTVTDTFPREILARALEVAEPAVREARARLDRAVTQPAPSDEETDAALAEAWRGVLAEVEASERAVAFITRWLARGT